MTITLPPDLERSLEEEARKNGTTLEQFVVDDLRKRYARSEEIEKRTSEPESGGTLYDLLKDHIGTWDGPAEPLSEDTGRRFGEMLEEDHARISERRRRP